MELYQDKKYIRLVEKVKLKLDLALERGLIKPEKYNRTLNALITQPDKAFVEVVNKVIENPMTEAGMKDFWRRIKTREDTLISRGQPIVGVEGHHIFHQNTVKRLRNLSIKDQLEIMHKFRKLGGTSGVDPKNLSYMGKMAHRASLLKDKITEVTAHMNPFNLKTDTGFWSDDYAFDLKDMSLDEIAESLYDEAYGPQKMLAKNARLRKSEVKTRAWITEILGGTDIFDPKMPNNVRTKYTDILNDLHINYNEVARAFEKGEIPVKPNNGEVLLSIQELNAQKAKGLVPKLSKKMKEQLAAIQKLPIAEQRKAMQALAVTGGLTLFGGFGTITSAAETLGRKNIYEQTGDPLDKLQYQISGLSLGGDVVSYVPTPVTTVGGSGISLLADTTNTIIDSVRNPMSDAELQKAINFSSDFAKGKELTTSPIDRIDRSVQPNLTAPGTVEIEEEDEEGNKVMNTYETLRLQGV